MIVVPSMIFRKLTVFCVFFLLSISLCAQKNESIPQKVIIELKDGSDIVGQLVMLNDQELVIRNEELGLLTFERGNVKRITYLTEKSWIRNPNPTRYFVGQSAFSLPKGDGYYQNIYGLVNIFGYGITDHLSVLGGVELLTLFSGSPAFLTNIKYGGKLSEKLHVAASVTYLFGMGEISRDLNLGTINALLTYGTEEHNITFGSGFAFAEDQFSNSGILTIGGSSRLSKRFALISENYILTSGEETLFSGGLRLINKKSTIDLLITRGFFPLLDIVFTF